MFFPSIKDETALNGMETSLGAGYARDYKNFVAKQNLCVAVREKATL